MMKLVTDPRIKQAITEAKWAIGLTCGYFIAWSLSAYCIPSQQLLWGIPLWFILACIITPIAFIALCIYIITTRFCDMKLDNNNES